MKLRDIDIRVYYEPHIYGITENNYNNREEYLKVCQEYYRDNIMSSDRTLRIQTRNISSFFSRLYYEKYKDSRFPYKKIIISCCKDENSAGKIVDLEGIAEVMVLYDYSRFTYKNDEQKKHDALALIMKGTSIISDKYNIGMAPFEEIASIIRSTDYHNHWVWKTKWNPGHSYNAKIVVDHEITEAIIRLKIEDKKGNTICDKKLIAATPDEFDYAFYLGKIEWQNPGDFVLLDKKSNIVARWSE